MPQGPALSGESSTRTFVGGDPPLGAWMRNSAGSFRVLPSTHDSRGREATQKRSLA